MIETLSIVINGREFKKPTEGHMVTASQVAMFDEFKRYLDHRKDFDNNAPSQDGELQGIRRRLWLDVFKGANAEKASEAVKEFDKTFL